MTSINLLIKCRSIFCGGCVAWPIILDLEKGESKTGTSWCMHIYIIIVLQFCGLKICWSFSPGSYVWFGNFDVYRSCSNFSVTDSGFQERVFAVKWWGKRTVEGIIHSLNELVPSLLAMVLGWICSVFCNVRNFAVCYSVTHLLLSSDPSWR